MPRRKRLLIVLACIFALPWLAWQGFVYRDQLRFVPEALNVWLVTYAVQDTSGFGPGGAEAGIIVYRMPAAVREALTEKNSLSWLQALPPNSRQGRTRAFSSWHATPAADMPMWWGPNECFPGFQEGSPCPGIAAHLNVVVDEEILSMMNEALFSPGAYYAFDSWSGALILIPAHNRIVYMYSK